MKSNLISDIRKSQVTIFFAGICILLEVMLFAFYVIDKMGWQPWVIVGVLGICFGYWTDGQNRRIRRNHEQGLYEK